MRTYELVRDARGVSRERIDTDTMWSAPARGIACAGLVEGFGTGSVDSDIEYDVFDSYADSHGPGSTGGRTHGPCPVRGITEYMYKLCNV